MGFWTGLINDAEKKINPAHVVLLSLTLAVVLWGCWEAYHTLRMPTNLEGAAYLLAGAGGANLAHKAEDIISSLKKQPDVPPTAEDK